MLVVYVKVEVQITAANSLLSLSGKLACGKFTLKDISPSVSPQHLNTTSERKEKHIIWLV